ncbi:UNVERIFIED_CONTAM: hypothetical protein Sangu_1565200 [Sesamum angustifolium]|uniref:Endonuclease/exonuclease/phosphatase domain-containing protein n=1 Tax=Sesamum angustifolium TaxID=2727405 RepID=A0AAW2MTT5_9LAMI
MEGNLLCTFSNNIPNRTRRIILETLQMSECNHKAKHLGLPFCKQNSRNMTFNEIIGKLSSKLASWKAKNLSQVGKMVTGASWTWQDVIKCVKIIKAGICFNVSTHTAINIWEDPWIPSIQDFTPKSLNNLNPEWLILVRDLIDQSANQWNLELLNQMFSTEVVHEIRKIQIPAEVEPSKPLWGPSKSGKFTIKSAFKTITQGSKCNHPKDELVGKRIWSLDARVCVEINSLEPLQTGIGEGFGTEAPGASSSGAKGTEDGVEMELHDTVPPVGIPEPLLHEEAMDGGTEKDIPISQSPPDVCQGAADVATCSLEPAVPEEPLPQDGSPGSDTEGVTKRLARHRRYRSVGDEPEAHSASPDRGKVDHEQLLHVRLESNKWPKPLFVTAVYAKCDTVKRRALWDALRAVSVGAFPWIVGGDFNTILSPDERSGGSTPSGMAMSDIHDAIADSALVDARYVGSPHTWYSRRLRQRLDRVLISSCWMTVFPKMQVAHLELSQSDHRGLLVEAECTMERKKLTPLKHCLKEWNKTVFGNVFDNVAVTERGLKEADEAYDQDPFDHTLV